jgi:hypothetical protein
MKTKIRLLCALLLISSVRGATYIAASAAYTDVQAVADSSFNPALADGDTVIVPAGTASWTSTLTVTKGITLQGAGNDTTVLLDDIPRVGNTGSLFIHVTGNSAMRVTGFTFRYGSLTTDGMDNIRRAGISTSFRVDHCHFDQLYSDAGVKVFGWIYGVVDHCVFDMRMGGKTSVSVTHENWGNNISGWGSWADPPFFGSEKFFFMEDNVVNNPYGGPNNGSIDGQRGGRFVLRHNTFNNASVYYHGSDSGSGGQYFRGTRAAEIYNNTFNSTISIPSGYSRGGALLYHDNQYVGLAQGGMGLRAFRLFQGPPGGDWVNAADGTGPWDYNVTESDGVTHIDGHPPYTFLTGTHTGGNNSSTLVVRGAGWTTNQWAGYSATNRVTGFGCYIQSNTIDTITFATQGSDDTSVIHFNAGDRFAIHKVLIVLDQPCRGQSDLIVGNPPGTFNLTGTEWPEWTEQALEPCYSWNNIKPDGSSANFVHDDTVDPFRQNVDFYNDTPMPGYTPYTYPHPLTMAMQ